jgi:hypothetical protein
VAVAHRIGVVQRCEQDPRDEIALLAVTRERGDDLVQVQVRAKERSVAISPAARAPADSNPGLPSEDCAIGMPAFQPLRRLAGAISHTGNFGELHRRASHCNRPANTEDKLVIMNDLRYYVL